MVLQQKGFGPSRPRVPSPQRKAPHTRLHQRHCPQTRGPGPARVTLADLQTPAGIAAAAVLGLPASVVLDELLDTAAPRVDGLVNAEAGGVRMFVARPLAESAGVSSDSSGAAVQRRPAVILIHQILGLQRREVDLAKALAEEEGVVAVAPDTFRGQSTLWPFRAIVLGLKYGLRDGTTWGAESVHEVVRWLKAQPDVDPDQIVVAGFCYGGGSAVRYAAAYPGEVAGVTIFYGRPLLKASEVAKLGSTPVLGLYGTRDAQFPEAMLKQFEADLNAAGVPHRLELFPGKGHAFLKDIEAARQGGAAGRSWQLFREFIRNIGSRAQQPL